MQIFELTKEQAEEADLPGSTVLFDESGIREIVIDVFEEVGTKYDSDRRAVTVDQLLDAIEERIQYLIEERKFNLDYGFTANCPECDSAMRPDRTWCSFKCHHDYILVLEANGITDLLSAEAVNLIQKENRA